MRAGDFVKLPNGRQVRVIGVDRKYVTVKFMRGNYTFLRSVVRKVKCTTR